MSPQGRGNGFLSPYLTGKEVTFEAVDLKCPRFFSLRLLGQNACSLEGGKSHLPEYNACYEVEEPQRVHNIPQVGKVIDSIHVPLWQERADRSGQLGHQSLPDV